MAPPASSGIEEEIAVDRDGYDSSNATKTVCVMDASGHFASALVRRLLLRGYTVHAALHNHAGKLQCIEEELINYNEEKKLKVFQADPFDYHSLVNALKGCSGLFYSFEPPSDHSTYDQELTAEVETMAAHNVLEACAQTNTVDKVVFTSSLTAVVWSNHRDNPTSHDFDERNWSDVNLCKKFKLWHGLSKTLAEKTAWALAMDRGISMVSINGGLVMGPDVTISNPYLKGAAEMYEDGVMASVDLRFYVDAHICVFEDVSSYGRYICFNHVINCNEDAMKLARMLLPPSDTSTPPLSFEDTRVHPQRISNKKLNKLMVNFDGKFQADCSAD
ncbi:hypothetical protein CUMW_215810 [Citrus unshiu]|uniref:NmrA-like domain-containing protein n=1 Tax=Citrus unshiu TaxID=55188 RepID=A0A2H5QC26_CITUN|nr:hypothetical protein CUMW_215810 [Citrus unshiu]